MSIQPSGRTPIGSALRPPARLGVIVLTVRADRAVYAIPDTHQECTP